VDEEVAQRAGLIVEDRGGRVAARHQRVAQLDVDALFDLGERLEALVVHVEDLRGGEQFPQTREHAGGIE
jgi:hypothetical protein